MLLEGLLELLAPTRCAGCDRPGALLCERCASALPLIETLRACPRCGAPEGVRHCAECRGREFSFRFARCATIFTHPAARAVVLYKDGGECRLADTLGFLVARAAGEWRGWTDAVVPVPASRAAVLRRGFDHGGLLAAATARFLDVAPSSALVCGVRADQRRLGAAGRAANVAHRFAVAPGCLVPRRVLLVDDVFTTGSTLDAAARALLEAGAEEVRAAAVARACEW
jgi:ComF family protein